MFSLWPALVHHLSLAYLYKQPSPEWTGNFLKLVAFPCIHHELKCWLLLLPFWPDTSPVFPKCEADWRHYEFFSPFLRQEYRIQEDRAVSTNIPASACNPAATPAKQRAAEAMRATVASSRLAVASVAAWGLLAGFKCRLCLSLPGCSGLP